MALEYFRKWQTFILQYFHYWCIVQSPVVFYHTYAENIHTILQLETFQIIRMDASNNFFFTNYNLELVNIQVHESI